MLALSAGVSAQTNISDKMYSDLKASDDFTYLAFSKTLLDFVDFDVSDIDSDDYKITGDLHEIKLLIYKPELNPTTSLRDQVLSYLKKGKYHLVENDDNDEDTEIWVHRVGKKISECHVIFQGDRNGALMSFFGDFKVEDVKKLSKKIEDYK